jgi:hypothetical protein
MRAMMEGVYTVVAVERGGTPAEAVPDETSDLVEGDPSFDRFFTIADK